MKKMIDVKVYKQSNYPVESSRIKAKLKDFLKSHGIVSDCRVVIALVNEKKMREIGKKYLKEKGPGVHNVLSFTENEVEGKFVFPLSYLMELGEIVVCYPKAVEEAKKEGKLINEKVKELLEHGALHLLGIHHEEDG